MLPAFCVLSVGRGRGIPLPIPLFLLWPLIGLAWLALLAARVLVPRDGETRQRISAAASALALVARLSGLHIQIGAAGSRTIGVRFV